MGPLFATLGSLIIERGSTEVIGLFLKICVGGAANY